MDAAAASPKEGMYQMATVWQKTVCVSSRTGPRRAARVEVTSNEPHSTNTDSVLGSPSRKNSPQSRKSSRLQKLGHVSSGSPPSDLERCVGWWV